MQPDLRTTKLTIISLTLLLSVTGCSKSLEVNSSGTHSQRDRHIASNNGEESVALQDSKLTDDEFLKKGNDLFEKRDYTNLETFYRNNKGKISSSHVRSQIERMLGKALLAQGKNKEALNAFLATRIKIDSKGNKEPHDLYVGIAYCRLGNLKAAQSCYSEALCLKYFTGAQAEDLPGTSNLRDMEASLLCAEATRLHGQADDKGALEFYVKAAKLSPRSAYANYGAGTLLLRHGTWQEAKPYLEKAVKYGHGRIYELANFELSGVNHWARLEAEKVVSSPTKKDKNTLRLY